MQEYIVNDESIASVADAIREKIGSSELLSFPEGFISAIQGIVGGVQGISKYDCGTYTPASNSSEMRKTYHSLKEVPDFAIMVSTSELPSSSEGFFFQISSKKHLSGVSGGYSYTVKGTNTNLTEGMNGTAGITNSYVNFNTAKYPLCAGITYFWMVMKF